MDYDPRHALPAPKGPDPFHWRAVRFFGAMLVGAALALYLSGLLGPFPLVARQYLSGVLLVLGLLVFLFGWMIRWILEG